MPEVVTGKIIKEEKEKRSESMEGGEGSEGETRDLLPDEAVQSEGVEGRGTRRKRRD